MTYSVNYGFDISLRPINNVKPSNFFWGGHIRGVNIMNQTIRATSCLPALMNIQNIS